MSRYLDDELLTEFDDALRSVNAAITHTWQPGVGDQEIDAAFGPLGLGVPEEARRWWRWHNGYRADARPPRHEITPRRPLSSVSRVAEIYKTSRDWEVPDKLVLQFVGDQPWLSLDCSGPRDAPVPIWMGSHGQEDVLVLPSMGDLVAIWIDLIHTGVFATDNDGLWKPVDLEQVPQAVRGTGAY